MTTLRPDMGMRGRTIVLDADVGVMRRQKSAPIPFQRGMVVSAALYGIEILKPQGWVPLTGLLTRHVRTFGSMNEALEGCIQHWQRTGHAARPFKLD